MFKKSSKTETTTQELIDAANSSLFALDPDSPEYDKVLNQIERLHKLNSKERGERRVSPDAIITACASIAGILIIVSYEHLHPIGSKALSFVTKVK